MPFNLSQIFGGWRRKESKARKEPDSSLHSSRSRLTLPAERGGSDASRGLNEARSSKPDAAPQAKGKSHLAFHALVLPHISEKATMFGDSAYVFKVTDKANKIMVKKAVEERYGVKVENVNIANMPGKLRRKGAIIGHVSGFKKAIVKLSAGQTISEF